MIVAEQKPLAEIKSLIAGAERVLIVGCGTCVTVCFAGGKKEAAILGSLLRMSTRLDGNPVAVDEMTVQRQCEWEFIEPVGEKASDYDIILSLGCGVGVQALAEKYPNSRVVPGLNTKFMGLPVEQGVWEERCLGCGDCILGLTAGICPITRCAKQLLNGPCGGSQNGKCEISPEIPCAWQLIWERVSAQGNLSRLMELQPPKDWSTSRDGGPSRIVREDLRLPPEYQD